MYESPSLWNQKPSVVINSFLVHKYGPNLPKMAPNNKSGSSRRIMYFEIQLLHVNVTAIVLLVPEKYVCQVLFHQINRSECYQGYPPMFKDIDATNLELFIKRKSSIQQNMKLGQLLFNFLRNPLVNSASQEQRNKSM